MPMKFIKHAHEIFFYAHEIEIVKKWVKKSRRNESATSVLDLNFVILDLLEHGSYPFSGRKYHSCIFNHL